MLDDAENKRQSDILWSFLYDMMGSSRKDLWEIGAIESNPASGFLLNPNSS